jgi:hypothetical protein
VIAIRRKSFERLLERIDESERRAEERHRELIARGRASDRVVLAAFNDLHEEIERGMERADERARELSRELSREFRDSQQDIRDAIRANTQAVLSVLDRLGPAPG